MSSFRRRLMIAQGRASGDYTLLSFVGNRSNSPSVKTSDQAYISTGYTPNADTGYEIKYRRVNGYIYGGWVFGADTGWKQNAFGFNPGANGNQLKENHYIKNKTDPYVYYHIGQLSDWCTAKRDDTRVYANTWSYTIDTVDKTLSRYVEPYIFVINRNGNPDGDSRQSCDIEFLKFTENGVVVRDFRPCLWNKADAYYGQYGFVDLCGNFSPVSGTIFYPNSGTGYLVGGLPI